MKRKRPPLSDYERYTGKRPTPDIHELTRIPQSIADGWQGLCSCGKWKTFVSFMVMEPIPATLSKEQVLADIDRQHAAHSKGGK